MPLSCAEFEALAATHVRDPIPVDSLSRALSSKPFIPSNSLFNIRDLGAVPGSSIRPGRIYRSGMLDAAAGDPEAISWLASHVKTIFDLRSPEERAAYPSPNVPGVKIFFYERATAYPQPTPADFDVDDGSTAWKEQLMAVVAAYKPAIRAVLEHVRDKPEEPFLFHCTGKNRIKLCCFRIYANYSFHQQLAVIAQASWQVSSRPWPVQSRKTSFWTTCSPVSESSQLVSGSSCL